MCRSLAGGSYPNSSSLESHQAKNRIIEETVICHSNPASLSSTESSDGGKINFTEVALVGPFCLFIIKKLNFHLVFGYLEIFASARRFF